MFSLLSPWQATAGAAVGSAVAAAADKLSDSLSFGETLRASDSQEQDAADQKIDGLEALREHAQAKLDTLQTKIAETLQAAGVALESPLELEVDAFGELRIAGGHPQTSQIEWLLNQNPALRKDLAELRAFQTEVQRLELGQRAERLEPLDPRAAATLRQQARDQHAPPPRLRISPVA